MGQMSARQSGRSISGMSLAMINLGKTKHNKYMMECEECEYLLQQGMPTRHTCPKCGHETPHDSPIQWRWHRRPTGYSRLIPPDQMAQAMRSVYTARAKGVTFCIRKTLAGTLITVTSLPIPRRVSDEDIFNF